MNTEMSWPSRAAFAVTTLCFLGAASICAQTKPDFSGTWNQIQPPTSAMYSHVERIQHADSSLKVIIETNSLADALASGLLIHHTYKIGGQEKVVSETKGLVGPAGPVFYLDHTYTIGGKEEVNKADDGTTRTISLRWEGNALILLRTEQEGANTTTTRVVWSLSEDGKTLTKARHITGLWGTTDDKFVFEKQ